MNRECCFTQVIKQIIKHHLWDLTVWLHMLELRLMVMLLVLRVFALERGCLWSAFFFFFSFLKLQFGSSDLSNRISPQTSAWLILEWTQVDMMLSRCQMRGSPRVHIWNLFFALTLWSFFFLSDTIRFFKFSHQILICKKKIQQQKKNKLLWLCFSGSTYWVLAPSVDGTSMVSHSDHITPPLDSQKN